MKDKELKPEDVKTPQLSWFSVVYYESMKRKLI
jgi:hypothetical protein